MLSEKGLTIKMEHFVLYCFRMFFLLKKSMKKEIESDTVFSIASKLSYWFLSSLLSWVYHVLVCSRYFGLVI
jgi:hypothetical protein